MSTTSSSFSPLTRRGFLKTAALAGAALLCPAPARLWAAVPEAAFTETRLLMGTIVSISVASPSQDKAQDALGRAFARMAALEAIFTRHDSGAPLATLNARGALHDAPPELCALMLRAQRVGQLTSGCFDVTVTPVLELFRAHQNPAGRMRLDAADMAAALQLVDAASLHVGARDLSFQRQGMAATLDGIAKGHIVDCASQTLLDCGVTAHLINAGGDIRASGEKAPGRPWTVGVEHPARRGAVVQTLPLAGAIATSGSYEVYFDADRHYHHLINPASGVSPTRVNSVSVLAPTTVEADALATALAVMIPQDALRLARSLPGVECCILGADGLKMVSAGWPA